MKPAQFMYIRPSSLEEALSALAEHGPMAKVMAGGQSLVPVMNMRLARPQVIIDLNGLQELAFLHLLPDHLAVGALTRHRTLERSELVREHSPLLSAASAHIGHVQIRNRGTIGGSLAHADPSAELPAVALVMDAAMVVQSQSGRREIPAAEFFCGFFTTALSPEEILMEVRFPLLPQGSGWSFQEVARRHGDFAICAVACRVTLDADGTVDSARVALTGVGPGPVEPEAVTAVLSGRQATSAQVKEAAEAAAAALDPDSDIHASAEYRRHLARVLTARALDEAIQRAHDKGAVR